MARTFRQHGVKVFHKPTNSLRSQLTHVKDKTDQSKRCGVIYHIQCSDCDQNYIGETERPLHRRLKEHQTRSQSAIKEHCLLSGHNSSTNLTTVLDSESSSYKRKVKEAIQIKRLKPSLNRDTGVDLPPVYDILLQFCDPGAVCGSKTLSRLQDGSTQSTLTPPDLHWSEKGAAI